MTFRGLDMKTMPNDYEELEEYLRVERQKFDALTDSVASIKERLNSLWDRLEGEVA
jgi:hypothetical protein